MVVGISCPASKPARSSADNPRGLNLAGLQRLRISGSRLRLQGSTDQFQANARKPMPVRPWEKDPHRSGCSGALDCTMNLLLLIFVLLLLFGGGGFYFGGPVVGGGSLGLILVVCLIIYMLGGMRTKN